MFCVKCGKEIQSGWVKCPYCGTVTSGDVQENNNIIVENQEEKSIQSPDKELTFELDENQPISNPSGKKIRHYSFWKYLLLSTITCGIYGVYVLFGLVNDINDICEGDGKKSPNYIVVLLLGIVTCGIYTIYWWHKQGCRIQENGDKYGVKIRESGATILLWVILGVTIMPGIGIFVATYIMFDNVNRIALGYNQEKTADELSQMPKLHPHLIRNIIIVYAVVVVLFVILISAFLLSFGSDESNQTNEVTETYPQDLSEVDLEQYIGMKGDLLKSIGFTHDKEFNEYSALEDKVYISCDDSGMVDLLMIEKANGKEPSFHEVEIGMAQAEAEEKLKKDYPLTDDYENKFSFTNESTGGTVLLEIEEDVISSITFMTLSVEELQDMQVEPTEGTYIFPDSDTKYLSEDEVRSVEADKLMIGRNEIFARHGRIFEDQSLIDYFSAQSWYSGSISPDDFNSDAVFNDFEKKNVELIKKVEDEISGETGEQQSQEFVIPEGTYSNDQLLSDRQALVMVSFASVDWVEVKILTMPESNMMTLYGPKIDYRTVQVTEEYSGIKVTLNWDSAREVTLTSSGQFTGMDSGLYNELTNAHYSLAPGFW